MLLQRFLCLFYLGKEQQYQNEPQEASIEEEDEPYRVNFSNRYEDDPFAEEESKTSVKNATPIQIYSQVRHTERKRKVSRPSNDPRVREKLSTGKTHIVYKEEGYNDENYDHLDAEKKVEAASVKNSKKNGDYGSRIKTTTAVPKTKSRSKRDVNDSKIYQIGEAQALRGLSGEKLMKHLAEVIHNSSIYDDMIAAATSNVPVISTQRPNLDQMASPSEDAPKLDIVERKIKKLIKDKENQKKYKSLYRSKPAVRCAADEIPNLNDESFDGKTKKRGGQLGDKLDCLKTKYFGKDPFDEPFFKDRLNVSKNVYDDVMQHINGSKISVKKRKAVTSTVPKNLEVPKKTVKKDTTKSVQDTAQSTNVISYENANNNNNVGIFSPLVFPTPTTEKYDMPKMTLPLQKDRRQNMYSSIFDINQYYPNKYPINKYPLTTSRPYIVQNTTPARWAHISFTTLRPLIEQIPQQSKPYRTLSRPPLPPHRWIASSPGWAIRPFLR